MAREATKVKLSGEHGGIMDLTYITKKRWLLIDLADFSKKNPKVQGYDNVEKQSYP